MRRCAIVLAGSRGVLAHFGVERTFWIGRVPLRMWGYGTVLENRTDTDVIGSCVIRATADATHAADNDAHEPKQRSRPRENAE